MYLFGNNRNIPVYKVSLLKFMDCVLDFQIQIYLQRIAKPDRIAKLDIPGKNGLHITIPYTHYN